MTVDSKVIFTSDTYPLSYFNYIYTSVPYLWIEIISIYFSNSHLQFTIMWIFTWDTTVTAWPVKLLEKVHGDESQQAVLGGPDGVAFVAPGGRFVLLLLGPVVGVHCSPLPTASPWGAVGIHWAFVWQAIGGRVPSSPSVSFEQLPTAMLHPVEPLHLHHRGPRNELRVHNVFIL